MRSCGSAGMSDMVVSRANRNHRARHSRLELRPKVSKESVREHDRKVTRRRQVREPPRCALQDLLIRCSQSRSCSPSLKVIRPGI
jgi:hypothetical protein